MPRFNPAFCRTFRPGSALVPRVERVMSFTRKSSTRIRSNRRARPVLVFSTQSLRRSASRARRRAITAESLARRAEPRRARASFLCSTRNRAQSGLGQCSSCPVDSTARYSDTSVYADHLPRAGSRNRFRHYRESDVPAARRITGHRVGLRVTHGASASVSHPADLRDQCFGPPTVDDACSACLAADYLKAFVPSRPAPRRATVCASEEVPPGAISISQRLLLHGHRTSRKPANGSARLGQLAALLCVVRRTSFGVPARTSRAVQSQIHT